MQKRIFQSSIKSIFRKKSIIITKKEKPVAGLIPIVEEDQNLIEVFSNCMLASAPTSQGFPVANPTTNTSFTKALRLSHHSRRLSHLVAVTQSDRNSRIGIKINDRMLKRMWPKMMYQFSTLLSDRI
ncbi:hypothetical protein ES705_15552 [subsurface metagenome]